MPGRNVLFLGHFMLLAFSVSWLLHEASADVMFEDHFDNGVMSPEWVHKAPTQWVQDGWLHNKDTNPAWPRDAMATVHDSDPTWTDYEITLRVDPIPTGPWEHANVLLRTDNFLRVSGNCTGRAYQLEFYNLGTGFEGASLTRSNADTGESVILALIARDLPDDPFNVRAKLEAGHIQVWVNDVATIDVVDPRPFLFGGIGVHNVWESEGRYDDVVVVPEPSTCALAIVALLLKSGRKH